MSIKHGSLKHLRLSLALGLVVGVACTAEPFEPEPELSAEFFEVSPAHREALEQLVDPDSTEPLEAGSTGGGGAASRYYKDTDAFSPGGVGCISHWHDAACTQVVGVLKHLPDRCVNGNDLAEVFVHVADSAVCADSWTMIGVHCDQWCRSPAGGSHDDGQCTTVVDGCGPTVDAGYCECSDDPPATSSSGGLPDLG